jgi:hypothetical protein
MGIDAPHSRHRHNVERRPWSAGRSMEISNIASLVGLAIRKGLIKP